MKLGGEMEKIVTRIPLSKRELWEIWNADMDDNSPARFDEFLHAARLIEKIHGIGKKSKCT